MRQLRSRGRRVATFCASRIPELAFVLLGLALRLSLSRWYDVTLGYDYPTHHEYVRYLVEHVRLPPYNLNAAAYHPPLFYILAAVIEHAGFSSQATGWISIVSSCLQLLLLWLGLEQYLPGSRLARVLALALAAVLPASVHVAGMVSNEALSDLLCTGTTLLLPQLFVHRGRVAMVFGAAAGACLGLALLTKISGAMVLSAFLIGLALAALRSGPRVFLRDHLGPSAVMLAIAGVIAGGHYVRHKVLYGKFVLTGYDQWSDVDATQKIPYLDRRTLGFFIYWDDAIYASPYWASASLPHARFWPMLVTTTFSDYYNVAFVPRGGRGVPAIRINNNPLRTAAMWPSRASVVGGTCLAALAVVAWMVSARTLWRRRDHGRLVILLVGLLAMLGQLHFSIKYPYDPFGPIKGAYLQFAAPIYCAMAGLAIAALWRTQRLLPRVLAVSGPIAIALVASYTLYARIWVPLGS